MTTPHDKIVADVVRMVRDRIGPVAAFGRPAWWTACPRPARGKMRATMAKIADGEEFKMPATIDDPAVLDEIGPRWHCLAIRIQ